MKGKPEENLTEEEKKYLTAEEKNLYDSFEPPRLSPRKVEDEDEDREKDKGSAGDAPPPKPSQKNESGDDEHEHLSGGTGSVGI